MALRQSTLRGHNRANNGLAKCFADGLDVVDVMRNRQSIHGPEKAVMACGCRYQHHARHASHRGKAMGDAFGNEEPISRTPASVRRGSIKRSQIEQTWCPGCALSLITYALTFAEQKSSSRSTSS